MATENDNSLSKQEAIDRLRNTIRQLEIIVEQLDETSVIDLPSSTAIQNLVATTAQLETIIPESTSKSTIEENNQIISSDNVENKLSDETTSNVDEQNTTRIFTTKENATQTATTVSQNEETKIVRQVPVVANQPPSNKLFSNKWLLISLAVIIVIAIPLSWQLFLSDRTSQTIAINSPLTAIERENEAFDTPEYSIEETENVIEPEINENQSIDEKQILETAPTVTTIPLELEAENKPKKINIETISPTVILTPEQNLLAVLDNKIRSLNFNDWEDLVESIEPDFERDIVKVTLADRWYQLLEERQNKIATEMLKKSRQLEFRKLQIVDSQNNLLARNPVVGKDVIILRRTI